MSDIFKSLVPITTTTYGLQTFFALIFVPTQNEKFYDLCGAVGWALATFISLYYPALKAKFWDRIPGAELPPLSLFSGRQLLATAALCLWTLRLGIFLTRRSSRYGGDSRFYEAKKSPFTFTSLWLSQATWISIVGLPFYLLNILPPFTHPPFGLRDYFSIDLLLSGFFLEFFADWQKLKWRKDKDDKRHDEPFISSGAWALSRHPNYLGEFFIWTGLFTLCSTSLQTPNYPRGALAIAAASPLFTYILLRYVLCVEKKADKKFAGNHQWEAYKRNVPIFWPKLLTL